MELVGHERVAQRQLFELGVGSVLDEVVVRIEAGVESHTVVRERLSGARPRSRISLSGATGGSALGVSPLFLAPGGGRPEPPPPGPPVEGCPPRPRPTPGPTQDGGPDPANRSPA